MVCWHSRGEGWRKGRVQDEETVEYTRSGSQLRVNRSKDECNVSECEWLEVYCGEVAPQAAHLTWLSCLHRASTLLSLSSVQIN